MFNSKTPFYIEYVIASTGHSHQCSAATFVDDFSALFATTVIQSL
ncbi:MAG: hypothetical protein P1U77_26730 [Rubripirellula sp.]|nr:hypothetical protein [Rubripirellula sp.]